MKLQKFVKMQPGMFAFSIHIIFEENISLFISHWNIWSFVKLLSQIPINMYVDDIKIEPVHEISNNVVCATGKASDQPAHVRSLIRAFASR